MSPSKITLAVTGSIAAYKSCDLVSKLVQQGNEVRVIMTESAQKFVGAASLQALSRQRVYTEDFCEDGLMAHIDLGQWCDYTIVYPATAQTINSFASGVGHDLLNSYFLAYDFKKPFYIAPAMNTRMLENPITQASLKKLGRLGCTILPTEKGELACGESGHGKAIDPEKLISLLAPQPTPVTPTKKEAKRILITAGGTTEYIDGVRTLSNISTGKTGAAMADYFHRRGHKVLLLTSEDGVLPQEPVRVETYRSYRDIYNMLRALGQSSNFDGIIHSAAISDYSVETVKTPDGALALNQQSKINSQHENITIQLKRNEKILPQLKVLFRNNPLVVGFKLTSTESEELQQQAIDKILFESRSMDFVVHNDMHDIRKGRRVFKIADKHDHIEKVEGVENLAKELDKKLAEVAQ